MKSELERGPGGPGHLEPQPHPVRVALEDTGHLAPPGATRAPLADRKAPPQRPAPCKRPASPALQALHTCVCVCVGGGISFSAHSTYLCPGVKLIAAILKILLLESIFHYNFRI